MLSLVGAWLGLARLTGLILLFTVVFRVVKHIPAWVIASIFRRAMDTMGMGRDLYAETQEFKVLWKGVSNIEKELMLRSHQTDLTLMFRGLDNLADLPFLHEEYTWSPDLLQQLRLRYPRKLPEPPY
jgi:hypothetical protein